MSQEKVFTGVKESSTEVDSSLKIGVYTVYDCVLKQFDYPFCIPVTKVAEYMKLLVNDVQSKYYGHETDYILNKIGDFSQDSGEVIQHFVERLYTLDKFVDKTKRNLQTIIQTLNFLPTGYFKMPEEQKKVIQEQIDNSINKYVENYVIPDMDINFVKVQSLEAENNMLKEQLKNLSSD